MTTINNSATFNVLHFIASVQIGTRIKGYGGQVMIVTEVTKTGFKGLDEYCLNKLGKKTEIRLGFDTINNPHYQGSLQILPTA